MLESLNFILAALQCNLVIKWQRRRSSVPMDLADDATHCNFDHAGPDVVCTRHSLPPPLQTVLMNTTSYASHSLGSLRKQIKIYLSNQFCDIVFPY